MILEQSILASVIFDSDKKIKESEYVSICESIETDAFNLNDILIGYKKKTPIFEGALFFVLNDGSRVLISEEVISLISSLNIDKEKLCGYMSESIDNTNAIVNKILDFK